MVIVSVDGNIGAGKSSVLHYLKNKYQYKIDLEPVDDWIPFLQDMYKNNKDAFEFQIKVWLDRIYNVDYPANDITLTERSGFFQWQVFAKAVFETGKLNERQFNILRNLYHKQPFQPDVFVYLCTDPVESYKRIHKRGRNCESDITEEYIHTLHILHENAYELLQQENGKNILVSVEGKTVEQVGDEIHQKLQKML
jgi:deoxyadenosine/deoxycytidine kinase